MQSKKEDHNTVEDSSEDKYSDASEDTMSPVDWKATLYHSKVWDLWSKFDDVASAKFLCNIKRQWLDAFEKKSFAQKENADLVILTEVLLELDSFYLQMKNELRSFAAVSATKQHHMAAICDELEEYNIQEN
jgi:hypothetical protein